jgi:hypothetical protein
LTATCRVSLINDDLVPDLELITEGVNPIGVNCLNSVTFIIAIKLAVALFVFGAKLAFESRQTRDLRYPKVIESPINVLSERLETDNFPPFIQLTTQCESPWVLFLGVSVDSGR